MMVRRYGGFFCGDENDLKLTVVKQSIAQLCDILKTIESYTFNE